MRAPGHEACSRLIDAIDRYVEKADNTLEEELKEAGYVDPKATMTFMRRMEQRLARAISKGNDSILSSLAAFASGTDFVDLRRWWELTEAELDTSKGRIDRVYNIAESFRRDMNEFMPRLITGYTARIDNELAARGMTKRTAAFIDSWSGRLEQIMHVSQKDRIGDMVKDSIAKGEGVDKLARRIRESGIRNTDATARRVALTETLRAHSYSQLESFRTNPAVKGKRWRHTGAKFSKPRANHQAMNGTAVPVDDPFILHGANGATYYPQCPRDVDLPPGESINCHCIMLPVVDDDILGLSLEERNRLYEQGRAKCDAEWEAELNARKHVEANMDRSEEDDSGAPAPKVADWRLAKKLGLRVISGSTTRADTMPQVNPSFGAGTKEWTENCQRCVATYEARRRGYDVTAKPRVLNPHGGPVGSSDPDPFFNGAANWRDVYDSPRAVLCAARTGSESKRLVDAEAMAWGDGGRGIVYVAWPPDSSGIRSAHVFTVENVQGRIEYIDAQSSDADVSRYFAQCDPAWTNVMRVDNLELTEKLELCCKNRK